MPRSSRSHPIIGTGVALLLSLLVAQPPAAQAASPAAPGPTASGAPASPSGSPGGLIMFQRADRDSAAPTTFAIAPDGTGLREILSGYDCCPVFSRDGQRILVGVVDAGSKRSTTGLVNADGTGYVEMQLPDATINLQGIAWGNGDVAAFSGWDEVTPSRDGIYVGDPVNPGSIHQITSVPAGGNAWPLAFSADGSRIVYVRGATPDAVPGILFAVDVDGLHEHQLSPPGWQVSGEPFWGSAASWSPDGSQVAFIATHGENICPCAVYVADADGTDPLQLASTTSALTGAAWSPDGEWIAFSSEFQAMLIHPDGSGLETITSLQDGSITLDPQWSPDGSRILFQHVVGAYDQTDLWTANADGSDLVQLTHDPGSYKWYSWAP